MVGTMLNIIVRENVDCSADVVADEFNFTSILLPLYIEDLMASNIDLESIEFSSL